MTCGTRSGRVGLGPFASGDTTGRSRDADRIALAVPADPLFVPVAADLVARRRLPGQTSADVLPRPVGESRLVGHWRVEPFRRIAGIGVVELVRVHARAALCSRGGEVPQPILEDRSADRGVQVVDLRQRRRCRHFAAGVVGLQVLAAAAVERRAMERVATGLRHDVHHHAGGFRFAEPSRGRERDLRGVADIDREPRGLIASRRVADVEAVDGHAALVVAAAVNRELRRRGTGRHVVGVGDDARHHDDHRVVAAHRRDRLEDVVAQHRLAPGALHVDDRALAGDGDRLLERADAHLGVDRRGERSGQLDAFAPEGAEPGQREVDGVGSGPEILDAVLAGAVADRGADFLDEGRTARFNGDARENRARRVSDGAGDDGLCDGGGGKQRETDPDCQGPDETTHLAPPRPGGLTTRVSGAKPTPLTGEDQPKEGDGGSEDPPLRCG